MGLSTLSTKLSGDSLQDCFCRQQTKQNIALFDNIFLLPTTSCSCRHGSCRHNTAGTVSRIAFVDTTWLRSTKVCPCRQNTALLDNIFLLSTTSCSCRHSS